MTAALLDDVERLIRNGDAATIARCCSPAGLELAAAVLAADDSARRDFGGSASAVAAYLRSLAQPQERAARRALAEPDRPPAVPLNVAGMVHGATADARRYPPPAPAPRPVEVRASSPAREPEQVVPPMKLATPSGKTGSATARRVPLAEAGTLLGLPLDSLPLTANVVAALRDCGLDPRIEGRNVTLDGQAVGRITADSDAANALLLRLCGSVRSLCHVGGGGAIAFRR